MDLWIFVLFLLIRLTFLVAAFPTTCAPTTQANHFKRVIPDSSACTSCNYFIGYVDSAGTWIALDCNPGEFFTLFDPTNAGCVASTASNSYQVSSAYCESTSIIVSPGTVVGTCGSVQPYCMTILVYPNLDLGVARTMIGCNQNAETLTYFRATTRGVASATTPTTSTRTSSGTTGDTQNSSGFDGLTISSALPSQSSSSNSNSSNGNGSNAIALGTGIGLGLPAVLVALAAWLFPRYRREHRQTKESGPVKEPAESPPQQPDSRSLPQTAHPDTNLHGTSIPPGNHGNSAEMEETNRTRSGQ
jgi:hypothetical protein